MIKENFEIYEDGKATDEGKIATVIAHCDGLVIFQDDEDRIFFLAAEPEAFDIGTVSHTSGLTLLKESNPSFEKVCEVMKGGK
ncbi:hypothetical protein [Faecalispora jeddahensis]|uniref:hypothetical protein n=1 Tax=Faecalispora jeddahensis TaxID=1414721 RepID=UPI0028ACAF91|nr:hypothetical protein [Faecalispora jeddahensis]